MTNHKRNLGIAAFGVLVCVIIAYANHFQNTFHFDDSHAIVDNVHIRNLENIPSFFTDIKMFSNDPEHWGMRPLVTTTLAIDFWLGGNLDPFYFQLDTFLWFLGLCVMLFLIYKNLLQKVINSEWAAWLALLSTSWFALHTANAETVNYIISRSDVLSTFCIAASFLIYISPVEKRKYFLYIIPAVIGVMAKETVLVLVILLFFYIILFEKKLALTAIFKKQHLKALSSAFLKILPLLIFVVLAQAYTLIKTPRIPGISNPFFEYLLTQTYVWLHYFLAFFLPVNLSADTDWTVIHNVFDERILLGVLFVIGLVTAIFKTSKNERTRPITFGLIWFAASLLPTSLAPFAEVTNDHRMFFAFVGLSLSVVTTIGLWLMKRKQFFLKFKPAILTTVCLVLALHAYGVFQRNKVWRTEESLWFDVTKKSPGNGRGLMNYGLTQMAKGNYATADSCFSKALTILPYYSALYINIGILKGAMKQPALAEENFKHAISLSPNTFEPYIFHARYLVETNRFPEAQLLAEKAQKINPYSSMVLAILMEIYNNLGLWDRLQQTANRALAILPNDAVAKGYLEAARKRMPNAQPTTFSPADDPKTAMELLDQSLMEYNQKNYLKCIETCLKAIKLKPDFADAYSNMGAAYNELKMWNQGETACMKALEIDPNHRLAKGNLNWARSNLKK